MLESLDITRMLAAFLAGYFLCLSGSLTQLTTNNALASPSTLGMDGFAVGSLLVAHGIWVWLDLAWPLELLTLTIFIIFLVIIVLLSLRVKPRKLWRYLNMDSLILLGLAFNLFIGAIFSVVQFLFLALNIEFPTGLWFGNFKFSSFTSLYFLLPVFFVSLFYVVKRRKDFDLMNLGTDMALGFGIDVFRFQKINLLIGLALTGLVVSFFGVFSFLGLILPHILRGFSWFRTSMAKEVMLAPFIAGIGIMSIDQVCYHFPVYGAELPVGMISGVLGAFFLIFVAFRKNLKNF